MPIISFLDVNMRYPETAKLADATQADSSWVLYAIADIQAQLSNSFAVPFSNNNLTAKDLMIDSVFAKMYRWRDEDKAKSVQDYIDARIKALNNGSGSMITTSGDIIQASIGTVFSTTGNYPPVFGVSPTEYSIVSSSQVWDEEDKRGRNY